MILGAAVFALVVLRSLQFFQHDDFMYVTTAVLLPHHALYSELPFLQMPLAAWMQAALAAPFEARGAYIALLASSLVLTGLAALALVRHFGQGGKSAFWLLWFWLALWGGRSVLMAASVTSNHALQFFLAILLLLFMLRFAPSPARAFFAGLLYGLLVLCKLNSLPFIMPLIVWVWPQRRLMLHAAMGAALAMLPFLILFAQFPREVWAANVALPQLNNLARDAFGLGEVLRSAQFGALQFIHPAFLGVAVAASVLFLFTRGRGFSQSPVLVWFAGAAFLAAVLPGRLFNYHFAIFYAVVCLILFEETWRRFQLLPSGSAGLFLKWLCVPALLVSTALTAGLYIREVRPMLPLGDKITRFDILREAYQDAVRTTKNLCAAAVFSSAPLPLLEGPLPLSPASAAGPFVVRARPFLKPDDVYFRFADPARLLEGRTALLAGYHAGENFEKALVVEALRRNYAHVPLGRFPINYGLGEWTLYLPPCSR